MYAPRTLFLSVLVTLVPAARAQVPADSVAPQTDPSTSRYEGISTRVAEAIGEPVIVQPAAVASAAILPGEPGSPVAPTLPTLPGIPGTLEPLPAADSLRSPVDTLDMSVWERAWWGSGGIMRRTGLFPLHPDNPTDDLRQIAVTRRRMLSLHQVLGLATVASMTATVVGGQLALDGHGSGLHRASLPLTIGLYATTATLALASPPGLAPDRGGFDSITLHRYLAVAHVAGMIVTPLLAPELEEGESEGDPSAHQWLGYGTLGTFAAAMIVSTFLR
jgi:hypothetical protein